MIIRLVKMTFRPGCAEEFLEIFREKQKAIAASPGCSFLQLVRDKEDPNTFFTISHWDKPSSLEAYRNSELFAGVWKRTSALFEDKPEAWSTEGICDL